MIDIMIGFVRWLQARNVNIVVLGEERIREYAVQYLKETNDETQDQNHA